MRSTPLLFLFSLLFASSASPLFAGPPSYLGITLGQTRQEVQSILKERFPDAEDPAVFEDRKTTMIVFEDLTEKYERLTLHFHPNGKLTGLNVTMPLEREELLLELLPDYGSPTKPTRRGYIWKLDGDYQINITAFEKGSVTLKLMDRAAYDKWGRPWKEKKDGGEDERGQQRQSTMDLPA